MGEKQKRVLITTAKAHRLDSYLGAIRRMVNELPRFLDVFKAQRTLRRGTSTT